MAAWARLVALYAVFLPGLHAEEIGPAGTATSSLNEQFAFTAYNGYMEEDPDPSRADPILFAKVLALDAARQWCVEHSKCVGFTHLGKPTEEETVEYFFHDRWVLSVDPDEAWTSYRKGEQIRDDAASLPAEESGPLRCEIQTCSG